MSRILLSSLVVISILGCTTTQSLRPESAGNLKYGENITVSLTSGRELVTRFRSADGLEISTDAGEFSIDDVHRVERRVASPGGTAVLVGGLLVGLFAILLSRARDATACATNQSIGAECP